MRKMMLWLMAGQDKNGNGGGKWDKATARARGESETISESDVGSAAPVLVDSHPLISKGTTTEDLQKLRANKELEWAPQVYKLEEGDRITGILEGNGPVAELEKFDKVTKENIVQRVNTWIIASPDGSERVSILSSVQLDRKLPPFVGGEVTIIRGKDLPTGNGQRVTDYAVAGPKLPDGKRRQFAMPVQKVIDVPEQQNALPAGDPAQASA